MARLMQGVSIVLPSPVAPKTFTSRMTDCEAAGVVCASAAREHNAAPAIPTPEIRRKSRRCVSLLNMNHLQKVNWRTPDCSSCAFYGASPDSGIAQNRKLRKIEIRVRTE